MRSLRLFAAARPHIERYLLAAEFVGACIFVRLLLDEYFQHKFFATVFLYPAVLLSASSCGLGPSLLAVVLSCISIRYFLMNPTGQFFGLISSWDPMRLWFFALLSVLIAYLVSQLQASRKKISAMAIEAIRARDRLLIEIEERRSAEHHLRQERDLLQRMIDHQDLERQTLCNDFHDGLIQNVVGSKMLLESRLHDLPEGDPLGEVVQHLSKGIEDGRRVIRGIRPSVLDEPGLSGLLHELIQHFKAVGFRVDITCNPQCHDIDPPESIKTTIFRICQEALTNSWKHSGCGSAEVRIENRGSCFDIVIHDHGCGIDVPSHRNTSGLGLRGIEARARLLGGSSTIQSDRSGTCVRVCLPLAPPASADHRFPNVYGSPQSVDS